MQVKEFMRKDPACCTANNSLKDVAQMMIDSDCGALPVVENEQTMHLVGIVTDRDIVCRAVAQGKSPQDTKITECFSAPAVTVTPESTLEDCLQVMEENQIRRIPVVDQNGACRGMVTQSQLARHADERQAAELLKDISRKTDTPSTVEAAQARRWSL